MKLSATTDIPSLYVKYIKHHYSLTILALGYYNTLLFLDQGIIYLVYVWIHLLFQ